MCLRRIVNPAEHADGDYGRVIAGITDHVYTGSIQVLDVMIYHTNMPRSSLSYETRDINR
jgi:hypothetical protein